MSLIEPRIDTLLSKTDEDRFLLCSVASHRAHDINEMLHGQRRRASEFDEADEAKGIAVNVAKATTEKPLTIAFDEIADGTVSYDPNTIDAHRH